MNFSDQKEFGAEGATTLGYLYFSFPFDLTCTPTCVPAETFLPSWCQGGRPRQGGGGQANWKQTWGEVMFGLVRLLICSLKVFFPPNCSNCSRSLRLSNCTETDSFCSKSHQSFESHRLQLGQNTHVLLLETKHRASLWNLMSNVDAALEEIRHFYSCEKIFLSAKLQLF